MLAKAVRLPASDPAPHCRQGLEVTHICFTWGVDPSQLFSKHRQRLKKITPKVLGLKLKNKSNINLPDVAFGCSCVHTSPELIEGTPLSRGRGYGLQVSTVYMRAKPPFPQEGLMSISRKWCPSLAQDPCTWELVPRADLPYLHVPSPRPTSTPKTPR